MSAETSQTLDRGLMVLEILAGEPDGLTVTELAHRMGFSRTVVYRLVVTLEQHGLLRRGVDGRCRLGLAVLSLARQVQPAVRDAAMPALRRLADSCGATAHLTVIDAKEALVVAVVEPPHTDAHLAYRVGMRHPLEGPAAGRAVLMARSARRSGSWPPRPNDVGWATSSHEVLAGAHGVAAPVTGLVGMEAAVGVIALGPLSPDVGPRVLRAAADVARALR